MSSVSKNPFAALDEEEDDGQAKAPAAKTETAKTTAPPVKKDIPPKEKVAEGPKGGPAGGERKGEGRGDSRRGNRDRRGGRGGGGGGGGDRSGGGDRRGFGGGGRGRDSEKPLAEMTEEEKAEAEAAAAAAELERQKEEQQMSLAEYLKKKEEVKDGVSDLQIRNVDDVDLKGMKELVRAEELEFAGPSAGAADTAGKGGKKGRSAKVQQITDLNFVTPPVGGEREGGGRGGRGGRREGRGGGRGGGMGRGDRPRQTGPAPNISDASDFPSL